MKGVIFAEMLRWVDEAFSPSVTDAMITRSGVASNGEYTTVGNYAHQEALALLATLADMSGRTIADLAQSYGTWLAARFAVLYPEMFEGYGDARGFLRDIDGHIHREMHKLYPDARTPSVLAAGDDQHLTITYSSHRPLADIAFGLVVGTIAHFGEDFEVERDASIAGSNDARFVIRPGTKSPSG